MEKITIKKFCEEYNNRVSSLKNQYIKNNLVITSYVPFVTKVALIDNLLKIIMIDKETGNIKANSISEYLLLTRIFIENYTNLTVETEGFYEEYDELKKSGLFDVLLIGNDTTAPLIPYEEIAEFKHLLAIKKADMLQNKYEIHSFITEQVDRFGKLANLTLSPILDAAEEKVKSMTKEDIEELDKQIQNLQKTRKADFKEV